MSRSFHKSHQVYVGKNARREGKEDIQTELEEIDYDTQKDI